MISSSDGDVLYMGAGSPEMIDRQMQSNLCQIVMNIPNLVQPTCKLFHSVNKMFIQDGHIFRFHPSQSQQEREMVVGLLVFLKGL